MRIAMTCVCTAVLLMAPTVPTASAETSAPPEVPPGGVAFVDDPTIVNARPTHVEGWSRVERPDMVAVHFTSGTPQCYGAHATATETPESVIAGLSTGTRA